MLKTKSKYGAKKVEFDGHKFDSKLELEYYQFLKQKKLEGVITDFILQPEYIIQAKFTDRKGKKHLPIKYRGDFEVTYQDGTKQMIDIKGYPDALSKLKKKMFLKLYRDLQLVRLVKYQGRRTEYDTSEKRKKDAKRNKL